MQAEATLAKTHAAGPDGGHNGQRREILVFKLGQQEYAIDILRVQEIRGYEAVTRIANAPAHMKGVVNLRGSIVPIIDMRINFALDSVEYNQFTVVIILNLSGRIVGIVVDGVSDVTTLEPDQIKPAPEFSHTLDVRYITGLGTVDDRMLILLDIDMLICSDEMGLFEPASH